MRSLLAIACVLVAALAHADDRENYNRRAAAADAALFHELDRNRDGVLSRDEAHGDLNLGPRFEDMDVNRDEAVTAEELKRYLELTYGVTPPSRP